jgi:hypothetical protein
VTNAASCLKLGLRDEIDSVKETKIDLQFQWLDYEIAGTRAGTPNPANRHDFRLLGQSFAPTNDTRRPAGRSPEYPNNPNKLSPETT